MSETRLTYFSHHWEAEMAVGYLADAGISARLVSDNLGGGHIYLGSLAGSVLLVAEERAGEARTVLEDAGLLVPASAEGSPGADSSGESDSDEPSGGPPLSPDLLADRDDLLEQLEDARGARRRRLMRAVLAMAAAVASPLVGFALAGRELALIVLVCLVVVFLEGWRALEASEEARRLTAELARLEDAAGL